jgi:hypothetical protein
MDTHRVDFLGLLQVYSNSDYCGEGVQRGAVPVPFYPALALFCSDSGCPETWSVAIRVIMIALWQY